MKKFLTTFAIAAICASVAQAQNPNSTATGSTREAPQAPPERMQRPNGPRDQVGDSREGRMENRLERRNERREEGRDIRKNERQEERFEARQERIENRQEIRQERREAIKAMPKEQRKEVRQQIKQENQRHREEMQKILPVGSNANNAPKSSN